MPPVDLSTHPGHLARRMQQAHALLWSTMVSEETTSPQFAVLNTLVEKPEIDQRTLSECVHLDRSTIADVVARLARRGLLVRVRDPQDLRRNVLRLTEEGVRVHRRLVTRTARMNRVFLAPLGPEERETLMRLMARVADAAEELRDPEATAAREPRPTRVTDEAEVADGAGPESGRGDAGETAESAAGG
ncbi:DNA-binding MarR family transcriptional regulator [Allostreptomyces psammosilenae]|uniref:DNA-binding MarR family transcriptional regulator n=1 Tax=Allostreptomyces psammosilenae TaxID=1892865 RepID=A0A853A357_9ACTN|nr:MarR family transcriptional regulator [Allostreptomyces psammosilenae]NYI05151.1 DNA-binding MarR family transcriptional regulator [Allostreptomyces psammosilenae]